MPEKDNKDTVPSSSAAARDCTGYDILKPKEANEPCARKDSREGAGTRAYTAYRRLYRFPAPGGRQGPVRTRMMREGDGPLFKGASPQPRSPAHPPAVSGVSSGKRRLM